MSVTEQIFERLRKDMNDKFVEGTATITHNELCIIEARLATLSSKLEEVTRERDILQANLTARAKTLLNLRAALQEVHDNTEDEGDRVYFGSTNDADKLHEVWHDLDGWAWEDIMNEGKLPDVFAISRKAHARAETAEAELKRTREALERAKRVLSYPVDTSIQPHGYGLRTDDDSVGHAVEVLIAALAGGSDD